MLGNATKFSVPPRQVGVAVAVAVGTGEAVEVAVAVGVGEALEVAVAVGFGVGEISGKDIKPFVWVGE